MKEVYHKGSQKGQVKLVQNNIVEEVLDFKGEKYQENQNKIDIFDKSGDKFVSFMEGNILLLDGGLERKIETTIHYYKKFFAICVRKEEVDRVMGITDEENYMTHLYTYQGLHIESRKGFWGNYPAMIEACNIRADFLNRGRAESKQEKMSSEENELN